MKYVSLICFLFVVTFVNSFASGWDSGETDFFNFNSIENNLYVDLSNQDSDYQENWDSDNYQEVKDRFLAYVEGEVVPEEYRNDVDDSNTDYSLRDQNEQGKENEDMDQDGGDEPVLEYDDKPEGVEFSDEN